MYVFGNMKFDNAILIMVKLNQEIRECYDLPEE